MNSLKTKLVASVTMLAVAAIMLTSASFAWYTVSTKGTVGEIDVEMKATKNLEIARAVDGADTEVPDPKEGDASLGDKTWGSTVFTDATASQLDYVACTQSDGIYTMTWGTDNRLDQLEIVNCGDFDNGIAYYEGTPGKVAVAFGVMLRSNINTTANAAITGGTKVTGETDATVALFDENDTALDSVDLTANTAKFVKVVVFFDGKTVKAEDVEEGLKVQDIKVEFTSPDVP